jgi:hypothetical protein
VKVSSEGILKNQYKTKESELDDENMIGLLSSSSTWLYGAAGNCSVAPMQPPPSPIKENRNKLVMIMIRRVL